MSATTEIVNLTGDDNEDSATASIATRASDVIDLTADDGDSITSVYCLSQIAARPTQPGP